MNGHLSRLLVLGSTIRFSTVLLSKRTNVRFVIFILGDLLHLVLLLQECCSLQAVVVVVVVTVPLRQ